MNKKILKKTKNSKLCGVCGGLAEYIDVDPTLVRLGTVLLCLFTGVGIIAYFVAACIMPNAENNI